MSFQRWLQDLDGAVVFITIGAVLTLAALLWDEVHVRTKAWEFRVRHRCRGFELAPSTFRGRATNPNRFGKQPDIIGRKQELRTEEVNRVSAGGEATCTGQSEQ